MITKPESLAKPSYLLRQILSSVLPQDAVDYIIRLIMIDRAHQRYLAYKATEEAKVNEGDKAPISTATTTDNEVADKQ